MQSNEQWLPVVGYEGIYEVSDQGRVRSLDRVLHYSNGQRRTFPGKSLKHYLLRGRYPTVRLRCNGQTRTRYVHHLVLEAFVGLRPEGTEACHANDIPNDNRLVNLRWDTKSANVQDQIKNGRNHNTEKTHCKHGHEFTPENTCTKRGFRQCRACRARCNAVIAQKRKQGLLR